MYSYLYLLYTISNSLIYCSIFVFTHTVFTRHLHDIRREGRKKHLKKKRLQLLLLLLLKVHVGPFRLARRIHSLVNREIRNRVIERPDFQQREHREEKKKKKRNEKKRKR